MSFVKIKDGQATVDHMPTRGGWNGMGGLGHIEVRNVESKKLSIISSNIISTWYFTLFLFISLVLFDIVMIIIDPSYTNITLTLAFTIAFTIVIIIMLAAFTSYNREYLFDKDHDLFMIINNLISIKFTKCFKISDITKVGYVGKIISFKTYLLFSDDTRFFLKPDIGEKVTERLVSELSDFLEKPILQPLY